MPIKHPELYPADWHEITQKLKGEVGWKCEQCGVEHGIMIYRNKFNPDKYIGEDESDELYYHRTEYPTRPHKVVLTTAHLDHNPANNERSNLRVLCQRCHLLHDLAHHQYNARQTRIAKRKKTSAAAGQMTLEDWI